MSVKCPKCYSENPDTQRFCGDCGTLLPTPEKIAVTETIEAPREALTTGSTFAGRYQIIEELGKGGMGKVYKALDKEIDAKIALKLIKPDIASDKNTIERFRNELKTARDIAHKNVCRMYDLNKEEGSYYITMEYVSGEDLKSFIRRAKQLVIGTAISLAKQVCDGLNEAHNIGVVHRDLKPSNIMIDKNGNARIMDFGIARSASGKGITDKGIMIGTPEYMSPEQIEGKEIDQRTDIYSLGIILYEMLTGRVPFEGDTALTVAVKQKTEEPKEPREYNEQISDDLNGLILKCLEKDRGKRFQSVGELRSELENIEKGIPTTDREIPMRKPLTSKEFTLTIGLRKLLVPALVFIGIVIIGVVIWQLLPEKEVILSETDKPSIAVLPFIDLSPQKDQEYFCDGMTDEIIARLSTFKGWKVIPRTSMMRYKNTDKDLNEIAQELDVTTILEGSIRKEKDDIRVNAKLIKIEDSSSLWSDTYEENLESVFAIQSDVSEKIANALKVELSREEQARLKKKPTENLEAYNLYLQGRFFWNKRTEEGMRKAINCFKQATEIDPNYALAYVGLADSYIIVPWYSSFPAKEAYSLGKNAVLEALKIDNTLAEAHTSLGWIKHDHDWDKKGAEKEFKEAIEIDPSYATAHHWYGLFLMYLGRFEEAINEMKRAHDLDSLSLIINRDFGQVLYYSRRYDQAREILQRTIEMDPNFGLAHGILGLVYLRKQKLEEALTEIQKEKQLWRSFYPLPDAWLGIAYGTMGKKYEAQEVLDKLIERSREEYVPAFFLAMVSFSIGENDQGFEWLDKAFEDHDNWLRWLRVEPVFDRVRSDPRYTALLKKIGLE